MTARALLLIVVLVTSLLAACGAGSGGVGGTGAPARFTPIPASGTAAPSDPYDYGY